MTNQVDNAANHVNESAAENVYIPTPAHLEKKLLELRQEREPQVPGEMVGLRNAADDQIGGVMKRVEFDDDTLMPFGKYKGQRLGEVPDSYWRWFLRQEWSSQWPDLVEYAQLVEEE